MKILILSHTFPPEPGSASARMFELAEYLVNRNHKVSVITGFPNYPRGVIYQGYKNKLYQREKIQGINVTRTFIYITTRRAKFLPRLLNYASFMISSVYGALLAGKPQLIYIYSPPIFLGLSAYVIGKLFKSPFVIEVNDLWPEAPIALGMIKNKYLINLSKKLEKFIYKKAHKIFFYSHIMRRYVINLGINRGKTEIHPLWIDTEFFKPTNSNKRILKQHQIDNKFIIMYAGNIGKAQGLEHLIDCAKLLHKINKMEFVIIGDGIERNELIKKSENYKLDNIKFINQQPKEKIIKFLSAADVLFLHLNKAPHRLGTIPAKILTYMSMGKPILAALDGEAAELINNHQCGIKVEPENPQAIAKGILALYKNEALRNELGENARHCAIYYYSKSKLLSELETSLQKLAN